MLAPFYLMPNHCHEQFIWMVVPRRWKSYRIVYGMDTIQVVCQSENIKGRSLEFIEASMLAFKFALRMFWYYNNCPIIFNVLYDCRYPSLQYCLLLLELEAALCLNAL